MLIHRGSYHLCCGYRLNFRFPSGGKLKTSTYHEFCTSRKTNEGNLVCQTVYEMFINYSNMELNYIFKIFMLYVNSLSNRERCRRGRSVCWKWNNESFRLRSGTKEAARVKVQLKIHLRLTHRSSFRGGFFLPHCIIDFTSDTFLRKEIWFSFSSNTQPRRNAKGKIKSP